MEDIRHKVGDRVTCITVSSFRSQIALDAKLPDLVLYRDYIVYAVKYCEKCGEQAIDVGLTTNANVRCYCSGCTHNYVHTGTERWCASKRFRKKEEQKLSKEEDEALTVEIKEILENKKVK